MLLSNKLTTSVLSAARCSCPTARLISPSFALFTSRPLSTGPTPTLHPTESGLRPPHLLTLADLSVGQIQSIISSAIAFKQQYKPNAIPVAGRTPEALREQVEGASTELIAEKSLESKTVALMFSKRSTRTRVASESAVQLLGEFPSLGVVGICD